MEGNGICENGKVREWEEKNRGGVCECGKLNKWGLVGRWGKGVK